MENLNLTGLINIVDNKTGELVRSVHNMVVNDGRQFILNKILSSDNSSIINAIFLSNGMDETIESRDNIKSPDEETDYYIIKFPSGANIDPVISVSNSIDDYRPFLSVEVKTNPIFETLTSKDLQAIASIGLLVDYDNNNESYTLFSRATFDPILLNEDSDFTITYYLYI